MRRNACTELFEMMIDNAGLGNDVNDGPVGGVLARCSIRLKRIC